MSQPAFDPVIRSSLDGASAGLASVATRSMKTRTCRLRIKSQKTDTSVQKVFATRVSFNKSSFHYFGISEQKQICSLNSSATIGASISTGTICVFRSSQHFINFLGTGKVNCSAEQSLRSNNTAPIRSGLESEERKSGEKPSVNNTASAFFPGQQSIVLGGPTRTSLSHWFSDSLNGGSNPNLSPTATRAYCLSESTLRKARPTFPQS